jgi:hypothetical protein
MKRLLALVIGVAVGAAVALIPRAPAEADGSITCWRRTDARSYTYTARYEDYDWAGGWWNNNDVRDTASHEGPDCSGLTFKTWAMSSSWGSTARYYWNTGTDVHGPYADVDFRDGCGGACYDVCGSGWGDCGSASYGATLYMDAFAGGGHIAAIYSEDAGGYDWFINAAGEDYGIQYQYRNYRLDDAKDGVRRYSWSPDPCPQ